jgi:transcriptional regulator with XRE-family HTH domain
MKNILSFFLKTMTENHYTPVNERIKILLAAKQVKLTDLADELGQPYRTLYNYIDGRSDVRISFLEKIIALYPDISGDWLLTGKGSIYKSDQKYAESERTDNYLSEAHAPYSADKAAALQKIIEEKEKMIDDLRRWLDDKERMIRLLLDRIERLESKNN